MIVAFARQFCGLVLVAGALSPQASPPVAAAPQAAPQAAAAKHPANVRSWEHETSDIPVNPRLHFGFFPSGMRYAWMENPEPKKRVSLRLHVNVGSLSESDAQRGLAHFLEHMAFDGSEHFPPGTLVEWLQKKGLGFGNDSNAFTDFSQTVYMLDLPENDASALKDGFTVLRDVADGLLLEQKQVDAERPVIDSEERARDSAQFRVFKQSMTQLFDGTRLPSRLPIGVKPARDAFTAQMLHEFYVTWYRPENFTLLLVGDLAGLDPTPLVEAAFGDLAAPATPPETEPPLGAATLAHTAICVHDAEIPTETIEIGRLKPYVDEPATKAIVTRDVALDDARAIVNLRLRELAKKEGAPFLSASLGEGGGLHALKGEQLTIACVPAKWKEALAACELELRKALAHGFETAELDEVRKNALRELDLAVEQEKSRASETWMRELLAAAEDRIVPTDAATERAIFKPVVEALTVEKCQAALAKAWSEGTLVEIALGALDLGPDGEKQLAEAWAAGEKVEVPALTKVVAGAWGYASDPARPGKVAQRTHNDEFDLHVVEFENGVRLWVKKTDFQQHEILVGVRAGEGKLALEPKEMTTGWFTERVFDAGGLGKHSVDELRRLAAGKQVGFQFNLSEDSFAFSGATAAEDLLFHCELACASLEDPGYREDGAVLLRRALPQIYERAKHRPDGPLAMQFVPELYSNDPRVGLPPLEKVQDVTMEQVKQWMTPALKGAPATVAIVGDLDVEATLEIAARTFGKLPQRRAPKEWNERRVFPAMKAGLRSKLTFDSDVPQALIYIAFAAPDGRDPVVRRNVTYLASQVLNDRLRVQIRERLGATYSPSASADMSLTYPDVGRISIQVVADPAKADDVVEACLAVTDALVKDGVTDEEVDRLRPALLAQDRDEMRANRFWLSVLASLHTRPQMLDELRTRIPHHEHVKADDLTPLAKRLLQRERASIAVVVPARHS